MNKRMIGNILGYALLIEAAFMLPAMLISLFANERDAVFGFLLAIVMLLAASRLFLLKKAERRDFYSREGLVTAGLVWVVMSLFGALPYYFSGAVPSYIDCIFETVSGFTTTGASVITDIEALPMGILYWRSFTIWLGGMGVLVFLLAIKPLTNEGGGSLHLLRAEAPGVKVGKIMPRMRHSAATLYVIYVVLTIVEFLLLVIDMPVFDALTASFATAGTGGFAIKNDSMCSYSTYAQAVMTVFMFLFGINFSLFYLMLLRRFRDAFRSEELRAYFVITLVSAGIITLDILPFFETVGTAIHHATHTVVSIMTTTGFAISDFDQWPELSRGLLVILMFVGACAGSTGGGLKIVRVIVVFRLIRRSILRALHPNVTQVIRMDGEILDEDTADTVSAFLMVYFVLLCGGTLLLSLEGQDFTTTYTSIASCLNNIGPALGNAGPMLNYSCYTGFGKLILSFAMLFGRLEIYPVLVLFSVSTWKK